MSERYTTDKMGLVPERKPRTVRKPKETKPTPKPEKKE